MLQIPIQDIRSSIVAHVATRSFSLFRSPSLSLHLLHVNHHQARTPSDHDTTTIRGLNVFASKQIHAARARSCHLLASRLPAFYHILGLFAHIKLAAPVANIFRQMRLQRRPKMLMRVDQIVETFALVIPSKKMAKRNKESLASESRGPPSPTRYFGGRSDEHHPPRYSAVEPFIPSSVVLVPALAPAK